MRIDIISAQPGMFEGFLRESIVARAVKKGACEVNIVNLRDFSIGRYGKIDDKPYGGGPGMLMMCEPWFAAVESVVGDRGTGKGERGTRIVMTSPAARKFTQRDAAELSKEGHVIFIAAAAMADSIVRLLPGVLGGGAAATANESFSADGLLEPPQYTHPPEFRGMKVPEVLLSGDHRRIELWRRAESLRLTKERRPDLLGQ